MEKAHNPQPRRVAVVGTGMAGLTTAYLLHQDPLKRYQATLLEKVGSVECFFELHNGFVLRTSTNKSGREIKYP